MKKKCELCKLEARTFCHSDEASLCWDCDSKVHGANFLVARHSRILLCRICHSLTRWSASGPSLSRSISICHHCSTSTTTPLNQQRLTHKEEEGENQVVPLSSHSPPYSPSSTEENETGVSATTGDELDDAQSQRVSLKRPPQGSNNLHSFFILQEEKGLTRSGGGRRVDRWSSGGGTVAKRFRGM